MNAINGKIYPLWGKFVDEKEKLIGNRMTENDPHCGEAVSVVEDIKLEPNGQTSAMFRVVGRDFEWACDVEYLVLDPKVSGGLFFCSTFPGGSSLKISTP